VIVSTEFANDPASRYNPDNKTLEIRPQDAFDWDAIDHEYGHYVEVFYGFGNVNAGKAHSLGEHNPGGVTEAFSEGWAGYFEVVAQQQESGQTYSNHRQAGDSSITSPDPNHPFSLTAQQGVGEDDDLSVAGSLYHLLKG
jgi:hypothetical protein